MHLQHFVISFSFKFNPLNLEVLFFFLAILKKVHSPKSSEPYGLAVIYSSLRKMHLFQLLPHDVILSTELLMVSNDITDPK